MIKSNPLQKADEELNKKIKAQQLEGRVELRKTMEVQFKCLVGLLESQENEIDYLQNQVTKFRIENKKLYEEIETMKNEGLM